MYFHCTTYYVLPIYTGSEYEEVVYNNDCQSTAIKKAPSYYSGCLSYVQIRNEREMGLEPTACSLGSCRSTN